MRKLLICLSLLIFFGNVVSQNLIPNCSFEEAGRPPDKYASMVYVKDWGPYSNFSSDYFSADANKIPANYRINNMGVPLNEMGYQKARTANAYAGLAFPKELIQCALIDSLNKDSIYYIEFFTNFADNSKYAIWKIGAYISSSPIVSYNQIENIKPQILNDSLNYLTDTLNWTKISGFYKAKGGEKYLAIGSFSRYDIDKKYLDSNKVHNSNNSNRYYYIDDVSLTLVNSKNIQSSTSDSVYCLRTIYFNNSIYSLSEEICIELDKVYSILNNNNQLHLEITGHADNLGDSIFNQTLSENRAKAVYDYLIKKGIKSSRLNYKGYGSTMPIIENEKDKVKTMNRRVELKIM